MNHSNKTTNLKRFLAFILSFSQILTSCNNNSSSKKDCPFGAHEKKWNSEKNAWSCPGGNHPREGSQTTRSAKEQASIKYAEADFVRYQQRMQHSMEGTYYGGNFFERSREALLRADEIVKARHEEQKSRRKSEFAKLNRMYRIQQEEEQKEQEDTKEHLQEQQKRAAREAEERIEEEIRRKREEDWLREGREKIEREKQEQEREWTRREEEARQFIEQSHREAQEARNNACQKRDQYYEEQRQLQEKQKEELERLRPLIQQQLEEEKRQKEAERLEIEAKKQAKKARRAAKEKLRWKEIKEATRKSQEELHKKHEDILRESEAHIEEVERTCKALYQEQHIQLKNWDQKLTLERIKHLESVENTPEGWIGIKRLEQKDVELEQAKSEVEDLICQEFKNAPSERLEGFKKFEDSNQVSPPISELFKPTDVGSPDLSMYDLELDMSLGLSDDEEDWIKHANKATQMWEEGMKARLPEHIVPLKISLEQAAKRPISEEEYEELQASKEKWLNFKEAYGMLTENDKAELTKVQKSGNEKKQQSELASNQEDKAINNDSTRKEDARKIQSPEKGKTDTQNKKRHQAVSKEAENLTIGKQEIDVVDQETDIDETDEEFITSDETDEDVDSGKEEKGDIYSLGLTLENATSSVEAYVEAVQTGILNSEETKTQGKALLQKIEALKKHEKYSFRIHSRLIDDMDEVPAEILQAQIETHKVQLKILRSLRNKLQKTCSFTEEELTGCKVRIKKVKKKDIEAYEVDSSDEEDTILGSYSRADLAFQKGVGKGVIKALKEAPQTIKNDLQDLVDTIATQNITTIIKGLLGFIQQVPTLLVSLGEFVESIEGNEAAKGEELGKYIADKIILYTLGRQTKLLADLGKMTKLGKAMEEILKEAYKAEQALKGMKKGNHIKTKGKKFSTKRINQKGKVKQPIQKQERRGIGENYKKPPKVPKAFPELTRVPGKTYIKGTNEVRRRWKDKKGKIYEWDYQHQALEKYNKQGKHLGEFCPDTGIQLKPANSNRKIEL